MDQSFLDIGVRYYHNTPADFLVVAEDNAAHSVLEIWYTGSAY